MNEMKHFLSTRADFIHICCGWIIVTLVVVKVIDYYYYSPTSIMEKLTMKECGIIIIIIIDVVTGQIYFQLIWGYKYPLACVILYRPADGACKFSFTLTIHQFEFGID